jgi:hypothetical protein
LITAPSKEIPEIGEAIRASHFLAWLIRTYEWIAKREALACGIVLMTVLSFRAALLPWMPVPKPAVLDEFSYLLAADTYASGRLTNPPHPFWQHFETFHVLQQPTYASKYPMMQGLVLAFGQKFFGQPWIGVYLSTGLMCAAICWMLQGWIAPNLALLGALLFAMRVGILSYWMNSYWGGAVPAIGGALVLGALARVCRRRQFGYAATWAVGLAILMHSRPYDGVVIGLATAAILPWWLRRGETQSTPRPTPWLRIVLPVAAILGASFGVLAYNNYRVTGSALTLPYQLHDQQYAVVSMFFPAPLRPEPVYRHAVMRKLWTQWNKNEWKATRADPWDALLDRLTMVYDFFFGFWPLLIPPLIWPYRLKTTEERVTVLLLAIFVPMIAVLIGIAPHYAAVFAGVFYLRFLQSISRLYAWRPGGRPLGFAIAVFFITLFGIQFSRELGNLFRFGVAQAGEGEREFVTRALAAQPGRKLVLVRYAPSHDVQSEWVYNRADIDAAPVVWAREMGPEADAPFVQYFHDRQVWLLEPDQSPPKLSHYAGAEPAQ